MWKSRLFAHDLLVNSLSSSLQQFPNLWKFAVRGHGVFKFSPNNHFYRKRSTASFKTRSVKNYFLVFDAQCLQTKTRERGIGVYSMNFIESLCKLKPNLSFAAVLTTVASDIDLKIAVNALKKLECPNLDIFVFDPFLGSSKISFDTALENLKLQLEELRTRAIIVLSPFEKHKSAVTFPFSVKYKQIGILYDIIPLEYSQDFLISRNQMTSYAWSVQNLSKFDLLFAISTKTKDAWNRQIVSRARLKVIYGGGHIKLTENIPRFKNRSGVLCVSAEQPHKNLARLIESYCLLPEYIQLEHTLTIVGIRSSGARKKFAKLGRSASGKIVFTEYLNETKLKDKYRESRLLVMPSLTEGLSLPILEAWSYGLVAVGSEGTVAAELLKNNSLLFNPFSSHAISNCMRIFLTSEEDWNKAFEVATSSAACFTWEATATLAYSEIERLLDG